MAAYGVFLHYTNLVCIVCGKCEVVVCCYAGKRIVLIVQGIIEVFSHLLYKFPYALPLYVCMECKGVNEHSNGVRYPEVGTSIAYRCHIHVPVICVPLHCVESSGKHCVCRSYVGFAAEFLHFLKAERYLYPFRFARFILFGFEVVWKFTASFTSGKGRCKILPGPGIFPPFLLFLLCVGKLKVTALFLFNLASFHQRAEMADEKVY